MDRGEKMTEEKPCKREAKSRATQKSIVESAETLFIQKGFAATAISEVASGAGVTKSLIHHHFGSKEALWDAVENKHLLLVDSYLEELLSKCREFPGAEFYTRAMKDFFHFAESNQGLLRMQAWICAEQRGKRTRTSDKMWEILQDMEKDQKEGIIRNDIPPKTIMVFLFSLVEQWFIGRTVYGHRLGIDCTSSEAQEQYINSVIKLFETGLFLPVKTSGEAGLLE